MRMKQLVVLALLAALAASCTPGRDGQAVPDGTGTGASQKDAADAPPPQNRKAGTAEEKAPAGPGAGFGVARSPEAVEHIVYNSTMEIPGPGYYAVDLTTGRVETWRLKDQGRVIRCLPGGTRLAIADLFNAPEKLNRAWICDDQHCRAWVRTEEGETGWVSLSTGSVVWAH